MSDLSCRESLLVLYPASVLLLVILSLFFFSFLFPFILFWRSYSADEACPDQVGQNHAMLAKFVSNSKFSIGA